MYDPIIQHSFQVLEKLEKWILTVLEKCLNLTVQNSLDSGYLFWFLLIIWVFHTLILTQRDADVHTDSCGSMFTAQHFMIYLVRGQKISECIVVLSTRPTLRFLEMITCWKLLCCLFVCLWRWCCGLILLLLLFCVSGKETTDFYIWEVVCFTDLLWTKIAGSCHFSSTACVWLCRSVFTFLSPLARNFRGFFLLVLRGDRLAAFKQGCICCWLLLFYEA